MSSQSADQPKKPKAVALLSGGLDSNLAVRMMLKQGIEVDAVAIKTPFCDFDCGKGCGHRVKEVAEELGVRLKTVYLGEEYLRMLKSPKHGYGSGMNPCIDCRAMMYRAAKEHMGAIGADFLITGEVLHQRPMSQNERALKVIETETGMTGKVLRPLSAKKLAATIPEEKGMVKRSALLDIQGRSRKSQLALARDFGISDPANAAGGCLLTDPAFSKRVKDLLEHIPGVPSMNDVELLKVGRHFRISSSSKLVVGRNHQENEIMHALAEERDLLFEAKDYVGPSGLLRGEGSDGECVLKCCGIVLRYSDAPKGQTSIVIVKSREAIVESCADPLPDGAFQALRI